MDSGIRLNDKTVVLAGAFGLLLQNLVTHLCGDGADVCVMTNDIKPAQRVCQNLSDQREVSESFGRATALELKAVDPKSIENAFSQCAEVFGSTDVYVDLHLFNNQLPFLTTTSTDEIEKCFSTGYERARTMTQVGSQFIKGRSRGRILYLFNQLDVLAAEKAKSNVFNGFFDHVHNLAQQLTPQNISVNALGVGVNEEYLLSRFPKAQTIKQAHQELIKTLPHAKMVDYTEISNITGFLASPLSSGLNGQVIKFDYGL